MQSTLFNGNCETDNYPMHPSGEVGRFQMLNLSLPPDDWCRSSIRQSMKQMHSKEFDALLQLPAPDRYALFIRRVADWEEVWSLRSDDGWCLVSDDDGVEAFPVWPHQQFADACVNSMDKETSAKISLQDWLEKWLPGMMGDGRKVAVFPTPNGQGIVVSPSQLRDDLLAECEPYE